MILPPISTVAHHYPRLNFPGKSLALQTTTRSPQEKQHLPRIKHTTPPHMSSEASPESTLDFKGYGTIGISPIILRYCEQQFPLKNNPATALPSSMLIYAALLQTAIEGNEASLFELLIQTGTKTAFLYAAIGAGIANKKKLVLNLKTMALKLNLDCHEINHAGLYGAAIAGHFDLVNSYLKRLRDPLAINLAGKGAAINGDADALSYYQSKGASLEAMALGINDTQKAEQLLETNSPEAEALQVTLALGFSMRGNHDYADSLLKKAQTDRVRSPSLAQRETQFLLPSRIMDKLLYAAAMRGDTTRVSALQTKVLTLCLRMNQSAVLNAVCRGAIDGGYFKWAREMLQKDEQLFDALNSKIRGFFPPQECPAISVHRPKPRNSEATQTCFFQGPKSPLSSTFSLSDNSFTLDR